MNDSLESSKLNHSFELMGRTSKVAGLHGKYAARYNLVLAKCCDFGLAHGYLPHTPANFLLSLQHPRYIRDDTFSIQLTSIRFFLFSQRDRT